MIYGKFTANSSMWGLLRLTPIISKVHISTMLFIFFIAVRSHM